MRAETVVYLYHKESLEQTTFYSRLNLDMMKIYIKKTIYKNIEFNIYLTKDCHPDLFFPISRKILEHFKISVANYNLATFAKIRTLMFVERFNKNSLTDDDKKFLEKEYLSFDYGAACEIIDK